MAENTDIYFKKREASALKTLSAWLTAIVLAGGVVMAFAKSFYTTPQKIEEHEKAIGKLERQAQDFSTEQRAQRDLLLEIRGDIKVLNRTSRTTRTEN